MEQSESEEFVAHGWRYQACQLGSLHFYKAVRVASAAERMPDAPVAQLTAAVARRPLADDKASSILVDSEAIRHPELASG
jgi:hypothetical protein